MHGTIIIGGYSMSASKSILDLSKRPSCDNCSHRRRISTTGLVSTTIRDSVFYCDFFECLFCENHPCYTGYKKRRNRKKSCL